jgi:hypothetical protein
MKNAGNVTVYAGLLMSNLWIDSSFCGEFLTLLFDIYKLRILELSRKEAVSGKLSN